MSDVQERYAGALMNTFGTPALELVRGEGAHVWDADGKEYVDLLGGIAVNALGHAHPADRRGRHHPAPHPRPRLQLLRHRAAARPRRAPASALLGWSDDARVFFCNSGAEANEAAFKLTRRTGRTRLVAAEGCVPRPHHGRAGADRPRPPTASRSSRCPGDVTFVPYGDVAALEAAVDDTVAAVVLEPIQGEAGVVVPSAGLPRRRPADHPRPRRAAVARRGADRHRPHRRVVRPPAARRASSPTSSRWPRASAAASRSARRSPSATRRRCSSPATTAPRSAATRSRAPPRSPCSTPSRPTACSSRRRPVGKPSSRRSCASRPASSR